MHIVRLMLLALAAQFAFGQTFEVASVKPSAANTRPMDEHSGLTDFTSPGGKFTATGVTLKLLIEWAYGIQAPQHAGGPGWLASDRYDVVARAEGPAGDSDIRVMLRHLLEERFHLAVHRESRDLSVYVLALGKNPPKIEAAQAEKTGMRFETRQTPEHKVLGYRVTLQKLTVGQLADLMARQLDRIVVDETGLAGEFDFTFDLALDDTRPNPLDPSSLIGVIKDQLGFRFESQKRPVEVLVIDRVERAPTEN